jgi:hypothetical protein
LPSYRLYRLDGAGKITAAEWVEADHDDAAVREAQQRVSEQPSELWERNRLVARIPTQSEG